MPDKLICAERKPEGNHGKRQEEDGRQAEVLANPARVIIDSRRLLPMDPETLHLH